jgi:hypothetical protein
LWRTNPKFFLAIIDFVNFITQYFPFSIMGCNNSTPAAEQNKPKDPQTTESKPAEVPVANPPSNNSSSNDAPEPPPFQKPTPKDNKKDWWKPIHSAVRWNKFEEAKSLLVSPEAVNCVDTSNGNTPIHIAAQNGHIDLLNFLIERKADVNAKNGKGNSPIHMAISYDYYDCVKALVEAGGDINAVNAAGYPGHKGIDGDKCIPLCALIQTAESKSASDALIALQMCETNIEQLEKVAFIQAGLKVKKALAERWTPDMQEKFKTITAQL